MRAGQLTERISIRQTFDKRDGAGQAVPDKDVIVAERIAAEVLGVAGGEGLRGRQVDATTTHLLTIRYRTGINELQTVLWGERTLGIVSVLDREGRRVWLELQCKEAK